MLAAREFVRSFAFGKFKAQLPQRSGLLKQKAYIRQRGGEVQLRGVWCARLVKYRKNDGIRRIPRRGDKYVARYGEYSLMFGFETKRELRDRLQKVEQRENSYTDSTPC